MKHNSLRIALFVLSCMFCAEFSAQINVTTGVTAQQLLNTIMGTGVITSNVQLVCDNGAFGTFGNGSSTNLNINSGIVLTTGSAAGISGPASGFISVDNTTGGNILLTGIAGGLTTTDECRLEFDVVPTCANLQINYVFGSEEYPEFVNAGYNDAFGFFISGPNPSGGLYTNFNIARVPGTGSPVTIDNINSSTNSGYYVNNGSGGSIVYDGFTTPLTASVNVTPCQSYHMNIVIADGGDDFYDSGVFLSYQGLTCPTFTVATSPAQSICAGQSATVSASGMTGYTWQPGGMSGPSISVSPSSTTTYTVTGTTGQCNTDTGTVTVFVNPAPATSASNAGPYCSGSTLSLFASGSGSFTWSGPNGFSSSAQNPTLGGVTAANSGTYTVTLNTGGGCVSSATTFVQIDNTPVAASSNTGPYCAGQTINLSASGGTAYSWSGPNGFSSSSANPSIGGSSTAMSGVYSVTVSNGNCSSTSSTNVTVNAAPVAAASNAGPYCEGSTISLAASGGGSYSWSGPSGFTSSSANPAIGASTTANSGVYTVTVTSNGCSAVATTNVSVSSTPVASSSNSGPVCSGQTINLSSAGGSTYSWSGPNGYTSSSQNPAIGGATTAMSGVYTVTVAIGSCTSTSSTNVTVNQTPVAAAGNAGPYCEGSTVSLTASGGGSYSWSGPNGFTSSSANPTIGSSTTANGGVYTVTVTSGGCTAVATTNVSVSSAPVASSSNSGPVCSGQTISLSSSGGSTYSWSGPNGYTSSSQNPAIGGATTAMSGVYTVTVAIGSCTSTSSTNVTVDQTPVATAGNTGPYCFGAQIDLSSSGGGTYAWSGPNGFTSSQQNPSIPASTAANSGVYSVTVTIGSCTSTATTNVGVGALVAAASTNGPVCEGSNINLNCNNGTTWSWSGPNGFSSGLQNPTITPATTAAAGTYSLSISDAQGCTATTTVNVSVNALPAVTASSTPICDGAAGTLSASGASTYAWSAGTNPSLGATVNASPNTTTTYTVTGTDANGCQNIASVTLTVFPLPAVTSTSSSICDGGTAVLVASGANSYAWTAGATPVNAAQDSVTVNPTSNSSYTVTGTDANGCTNTAISNVSVNPNPVVTASPDDTICPGASATVNAAGAVNYTWMPGNLNGGSVAVSPAASGTYYVIGVDANGCMGGDSVYIEVTPAMVITPSTTNASCGSTCDGSASISVSPSSGSFANYSYLWSNGSTTASAGSALCTGAYSVTVTDAAGCTSTASMTVTQPQVFTVTDNVTNVACNGGSTGVVTLNISGGAPSYNVTWSNGGTGTSQSNLAAGSYTVTITDANLCSQTTQIVVSEPAALTVSVTTATVTCIAPAASLASTVNGGTSGYTYTWSPSGTGANPTGLPAGAYTLTVTDANGCTAMQTTTVTADNAAPGANAGNDSIIGCGPSASLVLNGTSPMPGTICTWSGPNGYSSSTPSTTVNSAGTYVVAMTDPNNGCTSYDTVIVSPSSVTASFTNTPSAGFSPLDVAFTNTSTGADSYLWSFGNSTTSASVHDTATYTATGTYTVTLVAMNSFGCVDTATATIIVDDNVSIEIPNVFSPNGDGINDAFFIKSTGLSELHVDIFNRWGERVYEILGINASWDGNNVNGSQSADGTYFIMLVAKGLDGSVIKRETYVLLTR